MAMHQRFQHVIYHAEVFISRELVPEVHQILVQVNEPPRHQLADMQTDERRRLEKGARVLDHLKNARLQRPYCCRMVSPKQSRQFTKHRSWLTLRGNMHAVFEDLHSTLNQKPQQICPFALLKDYFACAKAPEVIAVNEFQDRRHANLIEKLRGFGSHANTIGAYPTANKF
jgi:hypothetical protein